MLFIICMQQKTLHWMSEHGSTLSDVITINLTSPANYLQIHLLPFQDRWWMTRDEAMRLRSFVARKPIRRISAEMHLPASFFCPGPHLFSCSRTTFNQPATCTACKCLWLNGRAVCQATLLSVAVRSWWGPGFESALENLLPVNCLLNYKNFNPFSKRKKMVGLKYSTAQQWKVYFESNTNEHYINILPVIGILKF